MEQYTETKTLLETAKTVHETEFNNKKEKNFLKK